MSRPTTLPPAEPFNGKAFASALSTAPGVYRMLAADGGVLYVGKAGALRNRVSSYFNASPKPARVMRMLEQVAAMDVTVTRTAAEALLLENQLIKSQKPRYNVLLRDDKSYPYILITREPWPRIALHRGARSSAGRYFGPYTSVGAVRETLERMHKLFRLRNCSDSVFKNRSRPCLQYQIQRCSAPCVGKISEHEYAASVQRASLLLDGRSDDLGAELTRQMEAASARLEFEQAARLRDLIAGIRSLQARQYVDGRAAELDVLACVLQSGHACVLLLSFRDGRNFGTRAFYPKTNGADDPAEVLAAFVSQHYASQPAPREIVLSHALEEAELLEQALGAAAGYRVRLKSRVRGERAGYLELTRRNAELALAQELGSRSSIEARREALRALLDLPATPERIECFDISHTLGEATVASCVVFDSDGPARSQYRRYNISGITPGDDYAAMHQALTRRFRQEKPPLLPSPSGRGVGGECVTEAAEPQQQEQQPKQQHPRPLRGRALPPLPKGEGFIQNTAQSPNGIEGSAKMTLPDLLLIDGGAGQIAQARAVLDELGLDGMTLIGVAKGVERRAGHETLLLPDGRELQPGAASLGLQLIQQVRDEAHRFAITGHRGRRQKARTSSRLEDIPGIGPRRRASLLRHFGGLPGLKAAGVEEIAHAPGINAALAQRIYVTLHGLPDASVPPAVPA